MTRTPALISSFCTPTAALATILALGMASATHAQPARQRTSAAAAAASAAPDLPAARLQDTYWKLVALHGQPVAMVPGQEREARITLGSESHQVQGFTGCNGLGGRYTLAGAAALKFGPLASTRKMCEPAANALERGVLDALAATTSYHIDGGAQLMLLGDGHVLARFEAVHLR